MSDKSSNTHLSDEAARIGQEWAKDIHKDLVKKGKRSEDDDGEETPDIVQEIKEVIQEVSDKTTEE
tara:strand:- start:3073 stop:3270 length:198 start_codon:yes stop_codon:yes gene_type:complete